MRYNKLSHYILSLLLSSTLLCGCNKQHPMAAMNEEEHAWQESVGEITILASEHLEAMDLARVPATMDAVQEDSAHGLSASRILEVGNTMEPSELSSIVRKTGLKGLLESVKSVENVDRPLEDNRARKKVISRQNAALLVGAAAFFGGYVNSLFTWHSASNQQVKYAQEHEKLANKIRTLEEALLLLAVIDVDTTPIGQASESTCVSGTRFFVPPSASQAVPVGLCTSLVERHIARKIQYYRTALATAEKEARAARDQELVQTRNALAALVGANEAVLRATTEKDEAVARANAEKDEALARASEAVARATTEKDEAVARANEAREELAARDQELAQRSNALAVALRAVTFGAQEWKKYFGEVDEIPLPADIDEILDRPCPFWPDKQVKDTHLLVLIPATVSGVPFTLNQLGKLIQRPNNDGHSTKYRFYGDLVKAQIGEQSPPRSYWLLMTRDILPDSRYKTYDAQKALVAAYASKLGLPYEMPHTLEAATAILLHHAREGERLFGDDPWTFTRCQEVVNGWPVVVGGFSSGGLGVDSSSLVHDFRGASCLRKF
jgi:hypothetical protein